MQGRQNLRPLHEAIALHFWARQARHARKHASMPSTQACQARKHAKHVSTQAHQARKHVNTQSTQARQARDLADSNA